MCEGDLIMPKGWKAADQNALFTLRNLLRREIRAAVKAGEDEGYVGNLNRALEILSERPL
jgi:hypothetical protein